MADFVIRNARVVLPDRVTESWSVACEGGRITAVGPDAEFSGLSCGEEIDAGGMYLAPGFIDLHIHGMHECLFNDGAGALEAGAAILPRYGVAGFLPTVCPPEEGDFVELVRGLAKAKPAGANILGFLLEGPYLAITGALPRNSVGGADATTAKALIDAAKPHAAIFAVSPELEGIDRLLPMMTAGGVPAFLAHTAAGVKDTQAAISLGARHATHFYDVFYSPPETEIGARPCGAVEAILADASVSVDFILDGEHVDPVAVRMALACKGVGGVCLVTDANRGAGLGPGRYKFGTHEVDIGYDGGPARFTEDHPVYPGALAGSGLTLDRAVRNAVSMLGLAIHEAVHMVSASPARVLGLENRKGRIAPGLDADLVLLDEELRPRRTWIGGSLIQDSQD